MAPTASRPGLALAVSLAAGLAAGSAHAALYANFADRDGYGNLCDAKFPGVGGSIVGALDLAEFRASYSKSRAGNNCGKNGARACAIFDIDEANTVIGAGDLNRFRLLYGKSVGPRGAVCPLACAAGASASCMTPP